MKAKELKEKLDQHEALTVLDVREPGEVEAKHATIPGIQPVPMGQVFVEAASGRLPKDTKVVAVCAKGSRCEIVARELAKQGYDIESLEGGLAAWEALETENG